MKYSQTLILFMMNTNAAIIIASQKNLEAFLVANILITLGSYTHLSVTKLIVTDTIKM